MNARSGVVLIVVLWISAVLTLLVTSFLRTALVESSLANAFAAEKQAEQLAFSGIERAMAILAADETKESTLLEDWADSEQEFFEQEFGTGFFTLVRRASEEQGDLCYGASDEASRINLNTAPREVLLKIPLMTEETVDPILDWRDADDETRSYGAESDYYLLQDPPYRCKNQPFETVEELLYVKGITPELLWGHDVNRNGRRDPFEEASGEFDKGLAAYVTVWSIEKNEGNDGQKRVNLNAATRAQLNDRLGDVLPASVISGIEARRNTLGFASVGELLEVGGMTDEFFRKVADRCTIVDMEEIPGLININTAPKEVLEAIPDMTAEMAQKIIEARTQEGKDLSNIGWLTEILQDQEIKAVSNYVTTRSFQFRFDSLGVVYAGEGLPTRPMPYRRIMAVCDMLKEPARLVYWKDWSGFGLPYDVTGEVR